MAPNKSECEWFHKLTLFVTLPNPTNYFLWMAHCRWSSLFVRAREKKKKHQVFVRKVMWMVKWVLSPEWFYFWGEKSSKIINDQFDTWKMYSLTICPLKDRNNQFSPQICECYDKLVGHQIFSIFINPHAYVTQMWVTWHLHRVKWFGFSKHVILDLFVS